MIFRTLFGALAATIFLSESALALSCARTNVSQAMEQAKASDDLYYVLVGQFQSTPLPKKPKKAAVDPRNRFEIAQPQMVEAWFDGRILSSNAANDSLVTRFPVDVEVSCAGSWCGSPPANGKELIAFVKARPGEPMMLEAGPCPSKIFALDPKGSQISSLRACFADSCEDSADPRFDKR